MNRFEEFETYVRVVEAGSITAAADQLQVAKSAVSRRIAQLEDRLGVQLMVRTTRQITLTASGQALYERALNLLADWYATESAIAHDATDLSGVIRLSLPVSFGVSVMGAHILSFCETHPNIQFDVDFNDRKVDLISEGIDLAIRIGYLDESGLIARKLAQTRLLACASHDFLRAHGEPQMPQDLHTYAEIRYSHRPRESWAYTTPDGLTGQVKMQSIMSGTNGEFLADAAIAGKGIVILPCFLVKDALAKGQLVNILPHVQFDILPIYAVYPPTRHLSQRVRAFVDELVRLFKGIETWVDKPSAAQTKTPDA